MKIRSNSDQKAKSERTKVSISSLPKSLRRIVAASPLNHAVQFDVKTSQTGREPQKLGETANHNAEEMLFALEISAACAEYSKELETRDAAKSLRKSIDDLTEIARLAERLRNVINGCDPAVINKMKAIGPITIDLGRYDRDVFVASRSDYLPITPQEMGKEPPPGPNWDQSLLYLGRLASLVVEGIRKQVGLSNKGTDVGRGKRSVHGLSTAHPAWILVKRLSDLLFERVGHRLGNDERDGQMFVKFVDDVLDWQFPDEFVNIKDAYVLRYLQCIRAINRLNALKGEKHSELDAVRDDDATTKRTIIAELERLNLDLAGKKRLLAEGPTRRNRAKPSAR